MSTYPTPMVLRVMPIRSQKSSRVLELTVARCLASILQRERGEERGGGEEGGRELTCSTYNLLYSHKVWGL